MKYLWLILSLLFLNACSTKEVQGLNKHEAKKEKFVMVANSDIVCRSGIVRKGTVLPIKKLGGIEFKITSDSGLLGDIASNVSGNNNYHFPANALLLQWDRSVEDTLDGGKGFVVYPDGTFTFESYFVAVYNTFGGNWWMIEDTCTFDTSMKPFRVMDNR